MITGGSWARDEIERPWTGSVFDRRSLGKFHDQTSWLLYDTGPGKLDGRITDQPQTEVNKRDARAHGSPCLLQTPEVMYFLLFFSYSACRPWGPPAASISACLYSSREADSSFAQKGKYLHFRTFQPLMAFNELRQIWYQGVLKLCCIYERPANQRSTYVLVQVMLYTVHRRPR